MDCVPLVDGVAKRHDMLAHVRCCVPRPIVLGDLVMKGVYLRGENAWGVVKLARAVTSHKEPRTSVNKASTDVDKFKRRCASG